MRHVKTESHSYIDDAANRPYATPCDFKHPKKDSKSVKVLRFIDEHPGSRRVDIVKGVWGKKLMKERSIRGWYSTMFSQMLYADLIDYNEKFEYVVCRKGKSILKKVSKQKGAK